MPHALADTETITPSVKPLAALVRDGGLLDRRRGAYGAAIGLNLTLIALTVAAMTAVGESWWQLLLAIPAAVLSTRSAFFGHDAGHKQIAATPRVNRALGLLHANVLAGMSYGWWVAKHTRHHVHPNEVDLDPDVGTGVLAWTPEQAGAKRGFARWLARHQAVAFFPLLLLEALNLQVSSVRDLLHTDRRDRLLESSLLLAHHLGYAGCLLLVMSPLQALAFAGVHHALFGLHLGMAFAPNHKGMPMPAPGEQWTHLQRQVLTARNVHGAALTDWLLGGLNYQIEHHLFPSMPRPNLRHAQPLVQAYCVAVGLAYTAETALQSYRHALAHLGEVGEG